MNPSPSNQPSSPPDTEETKELPLELVAEALDPRSMRARIEQIMENINYEQRLVLQWKKQFEGKFDEASSEAGEIEEKYQYDSDKLESHAQYQALQEEMNENQEEIDYWESLEAEYLSEATAKLAELVQHLDDVIREEEAEKKT